MGSVQLAHRGVDLHRLTFLYLLERRLLVVELVAHICLGYKILEHGFFFEGSSPYIKMRLNYVSMNPLRSQTSIASNI
jgi:hypothetical protein